MKQFVATLKRMEKAFAHLSTEDLLKYATAMKTIADWFSLEAEIRTTKVRDRLKKKV
jgi:hypothetical protein